MHVRTNTAKKHSTDYKMYTDNGRKINIQQQQKMNNKEIQKNLTSSSAHIHSDFIKIDKHGMPYVAALVFSSYVCLAK